MVQVTVIGNDVGQSLKVLKKKMQREGVFREMKLRRCHEKNSEKKARRQAEAVRRARKQLRKRLDTEGFWSNLTSYEKPRMKIRGFLLRKAANIRNNRYSRTDILCRS